MALNLGPGGIIGCPELKKKEWYSYIDHIVWMYHTLMASYVQANRG